MHGDWDSRDPTQDQKQWQNKWVLWELLILRRNNGSNKKQNVKNTLHPILILNKRALNLKKNN